jgi:hypothetical protein
MRIYAKCRFRFKGADGAQFETKPGDFQSAPDWIAETRLYKLALSDGSITELAPNKTEVEALDESNTKQKSTREKREQEAVEKAQPAAK